MRSIGTRAPSAISAGTGSTPAEAIYRNTATVNMVELSILLLAVIAMTTKPD